MLFRNHLSMLNIKHCLLTAFIFVAFSLKVFPQVSITGTVRDSDSGKPLPGAHITVEDTYISLASSGDGTYRLRISKTGTFTMKVTFIGYKSQEKLCRVSKDTIIDFLLISTPILGDEVNIIATRAQPKTPTTYSTMSQADIEKNNLGKDMPYIIQNTPSVVVTSDAGTGVGYTGINIRGSDLTRINVTLNGIPLNDAESQGVWFVDLPDLASSAGSIQIQRGVGTSTNGAGAFGASVNVLTNPLQQEAYAEINSSAGSFNTFKNTLRFGTGLMSNKLAFDGRVSRITSDGYIDRAFSKLTSFSLSGGYYGEKTTVKINILSGFEKTYQAWEGVPKDSLATNRTYNPAGEYRDKNGQLQYYDNQTDNYNQTHYQILLSRELDRNFNFNLALHYTKGKGYYENYMPGQSLESYGLQNVVIGDSTITTTDMVTQKWLDNQFYGFTFSGNYRKEDKLKITLGGAFNQYFGTHFGKITWAEYASNGDNSRNWYFSTGLKNDFNIFAKANYLVISHLNLFADIQYRNVYYDINGTLEDLRPIDQVHTFNFFNPKAGLFYTINNRQDAYLSFGVGNREPNRDNYEVAEPGNTPTNETVYDWEVGYDLKLRDFRAGVNLYYMNYMNQLVLTGKINSVGEAIMTNVPHSFRSGIELTAAANIFRWLRWDITCTFSVNKINDFTQYIDQYDAAGNFTGQLAYNLGKTNLSFSPPVILQNNLTFIPFKNTSLTLNSRYTGRQYIDNSSDKERSLDPYFVNGIIAGYSIHLKKIKEIDLNLALNNIFSYKYESNAWVYPYYQGGTYYESNGYFPQALFNFLCGVTIRI